MEAEAPCHCRPVSAKTSAETTGAPPRKIQVSAFLAREIPREIIPAERLGKQSYDQGVRQVRQQESPIRFRHESRVLADHIVMLVHRHA